MSDTGGYTALSMTESEIIQSYSRAKYPKRQTKILAELNGCGIQAIRRIVSGIPAHTKCRTGFPKNSRINYGEIERLYKTGLHDIDIAERISCHRATVCKWRQAYGLPLNSPRYNEGFKKCRRKIADYIKAAELYAAGLSDESIAAAVESSIANIYSWRARRNLPPNLPKLKRVDYREVERLYEADLHDRDIAEKLNCSHMSVRRWRNMCNLPLNGLERRGRPRYKERANNHGYVV